MDLLTTKTRAEQARVSQTQAQSQRLSDTAALFLALGGGWQTQPHAQASQTQNPAPSLTTTGDAMQ